MLICHYLLLKIGFPYFVPQIPVPIPKKQLSESSLHVLFLTRHGSNNAEIKLHYISWDLAFYARIKINNDKSISLFLRKFKKWTDVALLGVHIFWCHRSPTRWTVQIKNSSATTFHKLSRTRRTEANWDNPLEKGGLYRTSLQLPANCENRSLNKTVPIFSQFLISLTGRST